jgi:hypothetical protein
MRGGAEDEQGELFAEIKRTDRQQTQLFDNILYREGVMEHKALLTHLPLGSIFSLK